MTGDKSPARANDINTTEGMLPLGLQSRMVGTFGVTRDGPPGMPVPAQYLAGFHEVRDVSSNYFTKEELVGLRPDFLFAGWNYNRTARLDGSPAGGSSWMSRASPSVSRCGVLAFAAILWMHADDPSGELQNILLFIGYWIAPFCAIVMIDWRELNRALRPA